MGPGRIRFTGTKGRSHIEEARGHLQSLETGWQRSSDTVGRVGQDLHATVLNSPSFNQPRSVSSPHHLRRGRVRSFATQRMAAIAMSFPPLLGYVPREHIASGGQSSVFRALNPASNHLAAIKVVPLNLPASQEAANGGTAGVMGPAIAQKAKQLVREMRIHETLDHKNILRLFGGETREPCTVQTERGARMDWPGGLYMVLDLG